MPHQGIAHHPARTGQEIHHSRRHARLLEGFEKLVGDGRSVARGFQHHGVAGDDGSHRHSHQNRQGEVPGRDHDAHAQGNITQVVDLTGDRRKRLRGRQAAHGAGVILNEIDGFRHVGVRLRPSLADLVHHPGFVVVLALQKDFGRFSAAGPRVSAPEYDSRILKASSAAAHRASPRAPRPPGKTRPRLCPDGWDCGSASFSLVLIRSPPITRSYSRPNSSRISSSAYSMRRRWAGLFLKSLKGSFLKSGSFIGASIRDLHHFNTHLGRLPRQVHDHGSRVWRQALRPESDRPRDRTLRLFLSARIAAAGAGRGRTGRRPARRLRISSSVGRSSVWRISLSRKSEIEIPASAARALTSRCISGGTFRIWSIVGTRSGYFRAKRMSNVRGP